MGSSAWEGRKDEGWGSMRLTWRGQEWNKQKESNEWVRWWKGGREIKHLQNERRAGGLKRSLGTAVRSSGRPSSSSGGIWLLSPLINVSDLCPSRNSNLPSGLHKPLSPQTCLSWLRRFQVAGGFIWSRWESLAHVMCFSLALPCFIHRKGYINWEVTSEIPLKMVYTGEYILNCAGFGQWSTIGICFSVGKKKKKSSLLVVP